MLGLRNFIRRLRSVQAGDEQALRRGADNVDASAAAIGGQTADGQAGEFPGAVPPNYIKTYDEGRPRH
jgi:hypothetical protein